MTAADIFVDYVSWLRINVPFAYENLAPPADSAELQALDAAIGYILPAEVKGVLAIRNGQKTITTGPNSGHGVPCIPTLNFLSTTEIREHHESWSEIRRGSDIEDLQQMGGVFPGAEGMIKPLYTSPGWIPLWSDPISDDYIGLDLDPGPTGTTGQIINFGRDEERHFLCAPDFTRLMSILLEEVLSGVWQASQITSSTSEGEKTHPWFGDPEEHFFNALYARFK
ncbi:MAG TPA: SMI1/KNR4 family protein [Stackebrandtia sp.]|jgi:cell wall assembly regulator SMI1|uniref:SMI1/KNR4 family protein n=1 Tax=Stackebrandtia sp. TaxID=2023065 RepID=UPI002D3544CB|nr:SMI1/KNR4 family protein [Stackebrandtia sp.]HZE39363.1 SMI1/KNR4 family protein [Stackebrandtia sp.]